MAPAAAAEPLPVLSLVLAAACWGIGTVVSKRAVDELPALVLLPVQLLASLAVLALLMRWRSIPFRDRSAPAVLGRLGALNPGLAYALSLLGLLHISASLSVLIWAIEPLLILLLAGLVLGERLGPSLIVLSAVAIGGLVLVIYDPTASGALLGVALTVAGVACCAVYSVIARRWLDEAGSTVQVVALQEVYALAAAIALLVVAVLAGLVTLPGTVSPVAWASAVVSGVLYYGAAYWLYLSGLRRVAASVAAVSFYLVPAFGVAGGVLLLGDRLQPSQWIGALVVFVAVIGVFRIAAGEAGRPVALPS